MILNGDDLIVSHLKPENERVYFGIEELPRDGKGPSEYCPGYYCMPGM